MTPFDLLVARLRSDRNIAAKEEIGATAAVLGLTGESSGKPGDDCAVLPGPDGFTLFATEGFINGFVQADPWFAGWCGVMVNLSDITAMGGRAVAVTNALWAPDLTAARPVLQGMRAASEAYGVPIVGGHTNLHTGQLQLAVSIIGHAKALISSFDARPGDMLVAAVDHRGDYRAPFDNWQAALSAPADRLRGDLEIMPGLAEDGLVRAGKDISQGGIVGTAIMLAESSRVGIEIDLDRAPVPAGVSLDRWLQSFPSFGFLLAVSPASLPGTLSRFATRGIAAAAIGRVVSGSAVSVTMGGNVAVIRDHAENPLMGLQREVADA